MPEPLVLHEDRFFDPDQAIRRVARSLYEETRGLPLICPHGHVDAAVLADDEPFPEPTALIIMPDHYILRMLYSRGMPMSALGIPARDGSSGEGDRRKIWQTFGDHYFLFRGTPTGAWLDHELHDVFGVREKLAGETAQSIYDQIAVQLRHPDFRPRALYERFNIEVLCTTDRATDSLAEHQAIRDSDWPGVVLPTFRPDALLSIATASWRSALNDLERVTDRSIDRFVDFITAIEERRAFFKRMGAIATDHGVLEPYTDRLSRTELERLFERARRGEAAAADQRRFEGHMLLEMARMSVEDGLVMQLHAGAYRDHNLFVSERYGPDRGGDIPIATEYTRNLQPLLTAYGNDPRLTLLDSGAS
jgi:glucuronate isomerase